MKILILLNIAILLACHTSAEVCPKDYLRFSKVHSYCQPPNPQCNVLSDLITPTHVDVILKQHNVRRSKLATGKIEDLPKASNMLQMVWDKELAAVAQKHAYQCVFKHDCGDCRRVMNFGVGQNIAMEYTSSSDIPESNWPEMIKSWFDGELPFFPRSCVDSFVPSTDKKKQYGHFTQVGWATTWRVGCGYVLFKEGKWFKKIYVCNYGPSGNTESTSMYKRGPACSECPVNSCCGASCGTDFGYEGLCKIIDDKAPAYPSKGAYLFYCDFHSQDDCNIYNSAQSPWKIFTTLSGNFIRIILKGGQESSLTFSTKLKPQNKFCVVTKYRKSPNKDGDEDISKAQQIYKIVPTGQEITQGLPSYPKPFRNQFSKFSMTLNWNMETEIKFTFSVPPGKPDQVLEIQEVYAHNGDCKN